MAETKIIRINSDNSLDIAGELIELEENIIKLMSNGNIQVKEFIEGSALNYDSNYRLTSTLLRENQTLA
ncbi:hypothetical protein [Thermosipho sp. (in: thermotogales)]|jgi:hypothetical protein|uniref:hypothetical protein n=1 Tax=Thermosipho sp. (in: thermotogales) TaxID=1968895 RepID=UPI00257EF033|nr:hypothetical protein [Thermosipho sp. (in: thermotogales)]MBZ4649167.1 hypothetical protein [Thermosipho sp. (in: thermotogales)]